MLDNQTFLRRSDAGISSADVADETVVYDESSSAYASLNNSAAFIWRHIGDGATVGQLAALISTTFGVDVETAERDVLSLAATLVERGILVAGIDEDT